MEVNSNTLAGLVAGAGLGAAAACYVLRRPYRPPAVWKYVPAGGKWGSVNKPTAGAQKQAELPVGKHPLQLYSLATPNGQKVTIMLEELGVEYDAHKIMINGDQFGSGFVALNPNSKIPALADHSISPQRVFESGAILLYLAEKHGKFLPRDPRMRQECLCWLFWQMASAPYIGGGFGHFFTYAPTKIEYGINRFAMEAKRQLDLLDKHLATNKYMCGDEYTIADMAIWPWYGGIMLGRLYPGSAEFLAVAEYKNLMRWAREIDERPAVKRGRIVNSQKLPERHSVRDFDGIEL
eukprot:TRINITY_DN19042_c0_g1_i1.p1 TRINITY_DN19042_c0_g1~~TRINITY_DN19042_c0_g1_i1.p1  ORF type:complete len:317 (+),score=123.43 TRINITY_DN19042_c0_g1_i1:71-952(+)